MAWYGGWAPYVPVAERRKRAAREVAKVMKRLGRPAEPIAIEGRAIARTFWGSAWCDNLERYSDFENRLPRGRTYARNGSVVDLHVRPGRVEALVNGSELYRITVAIRPLPAARWRALRHECAGQIASLVELLEGRLSRAVMEVLVRKGSGLFPAPDEIDLDCSCPDGAYLCKHLAATLYGVGARLDDRPELLFTLRQVDQLELVADAGAAPALAGAAPSGDALGDGADLARLFGIDLDAGSPQSAPAEPRRARMRPERATAEPLPAAARVARRPRALAKVDRTITAAQLLAAGIPRTTFQNWVTRGALRRTGARGVYLRTAATDHLLAAFYRRRA